MAIMHLYSSSLVSVRANCGALAEAYSHGYLQNFRKQKDLREQLSQRGPWLPSRTPRSYIIWQRFNFSKIAVGRNC